jgi:hypothetical protein
MAFTDAGPTTSRRLLPCALFVAVMALLLMTHETGEATAESYAAAAAGAAAAPVLEEAVIGPAIEVAADQDLLDVVLCCGAALVCAMVLVAVLLGRRHRQPSWLLGRCPSFRVMAWWCASLRHGSRRPAHLVAVLIR